MRQKTRILCSLELLFVVVILLCQYQITNGQDITVSLSPTINSAYHYQFVAGGAAYKCAPGFISSVEYEFRNDRKISLGFGLNYQYSQVTVKPPYDPTIEYDVSHNEKINILSFSLNSTIKMKKNYFLSIDPFIGIQLRSPSQTSIGDQTGIGISTGIGRKFDLDKCYLKIEPSFRINNLLPFVDGNLPQRVTSLGLKMGIEIKNIQSK